jgi:aryl-alcohol dehydrogenase-like predicted oxidoreductase
MMRTRTLGRSGLELTVIGYGAWEASEHWGPVEEEGIIQAIHAALDAGINWIDTAEVYGPHTSERIVGKALVGKPEVLLATKVAPKPAGTGHGRDDVRKACEGSLQRLGRNVIDLYQLHWPDSRTPVEETWEAMASLVEEGLVKAIGVSNYREDEIERCEKIHPVASGQPHLSMLHRNNRDLVRWCGEHGIGVVAYSPLACGLLSGAIDKSTKFERGDWRGGDRGFDLYNAYFAPKALDRNLATIDRLRPIADRLGIELAHLAIAWVLHQPGVTAAIVGSRNPKHVRSNARGAEVDLDQQTLTEIEEILGRR